MLRNETSRFDGINKMQITIDDDKTDGLKDSGDGDSRTASSSKIGTLPKVKATPKPKAEAYAKANKMDSVSPAMAARQMPTILRGRKVS